MTEQLYTLADAKLELARQDCADFGHQWQVVDVRTTDEPAGRPVEAKCTRCTQHHAIVTEPTVDAPAAGE